MAHWRDGGIGNMAGSDDRPIEEFTLLEKLAALSGLKAGDPAPKFLCGINDWASVLGKISQEAFTEIDRLREELSLANGALARIPQWRPIDTALIAELREKVIVGGGYADVSGDELDRLIALIPLPAPKVEA